MGPEGGFRGGLVVAEGTPEEVAKVSASYTGQFLAEILENNRQNKKAPTSVKKKPATKKK
jgi:excinuclease ABC subunit A